MEKICRECGQLKQHEAHGLCRTCYSQWWKKQNPERAKQHNRNWKTKNQEKIKKYSKEYYHKNKEIIKQKSLNYVLNHPDKYKKRQKKWREKNKERLNKYSRKYYHSHKQKHLLYVKRWRKNNPEKTREIAKNWREANPEKVKKMKKICDFKRRLTGYIISKARENIINNNLFKYGNIVCEKCKKPCEDNYHFDHIVPLSRGGDHSQSNLQILCASCNRKKYTKIANYKQSVLNQQNLIRDQEA